MPFRRRDVESVFLNPLLKPSQHVHQYRHGHQVSGVCDSNK
jgi:hypothetical protein